MALWDRILSLFRSTPAPKPPRPQVHGRVVWGEFGDPLPPLPDDPPGSSKPLSGEPVSLELPDKELNVISSSTPPLEEANALAAVEKEPGLEGLEEVRKEKPKKYSRPIPSPHPSSVEDTRFLSYLEWLGDAPGYSKFCRHANASDPFTCLVCGAPVAKEERLPLQSSRSVHRSCYRKCWDTFSQISSIKAAHLLFAEKSDSLLCFHWIHERWPTYPPDWDSRRERVLKRAGRECEECGEREDELDVHHKTPIAQGGLHSPENLICLCRDCHERAHGRTLGDFSPTAKGESAYSRRMAFLAEAMRDGTSVRFHYRDQKGRETDRVFSPKAWETRHGVQCVKGYCHLRKSNRTFIVRRMSKVATEK